MVEFNSNRLKGERVARGITVTEMADKMAMTKGTYSKKENGFLRITVDDLAKAIEILDIPEEQLGIFFTKIVAN